MRWQGGRESSNVEDDRGSGGGLIIGGGIGGVVILLLALFLGVNPQALLQQLPVQQAPGQARRADPAEDRLAKFVSVVLADTEDVWHDLFRQMGREYREPKLVLFTGQIDSACGQAGAAMGPFYCPLDEKVYIDLRFYDELQRRFHAPGDFAQAYVIAHEVGHHVQKLLGITQRIDRARGRVSPSEYNRLSVRLELQADFFAGVWAHHAQRMRHLLEQGDLEEAIRAASAIGDDTLQRQTQGRVVPDSFTHGTSAQRVRWFRRGFETGDIRQGDTFAAQSL